MQWNGTRLKIDNNFARKEILGGINKITITELHNFTSI